MSERDGLAKTMRQLVEWGAAVEAGRAAALQHGERLRRVSGAGIPPLIYASIFA